jgi:hypothetical protein
MRSLMLILNPIPMIIMNRVSQDLDSVEQDLESQGNRQIVK